MLDRAKADILFTMIQDLKQAKFVVEIEPSATVCHSRLAIFYHVDSIFLVKRHLVRG